MRAHLLSTTRSGLELPSGLDNACEGEIRDDLTALGAATARSWAIMDGRNPDRPFLPLREVLARSAWLTQPSLQESLALVASHLDSLGFTDLSYRRMNAEIGRYVSELHFRGVRSLNAATPEHARTFVFGPVRDRVRRDEWKDPAPATTALRRTATRTLYMVARHLGLADSDPTLDIKVEPRTGRRARPLSEGEEMLGRVASRMYFTDAWNPSIWALGQASATTSEMGAARVRDVRLNSRNVWLTGSRNREPRWGKLTYWGHDMLAARIEELDNDPDRLLVYDGIGGLDRAASSVGMRMIDILTRAGLREPSIVPSSLAAWAGRVTFDETSRIECAAKTLGVRSLDAAAEIIGWKWGDDAST